MCFGGGSSTTIIPTTSSSSIPGWLSKAGENLISRSQRIADKPYTAYPGPQVAPLAQNQSAAINSAFANKNLGSGFINRGLAFNQRAATTVPEADIGSYMNPYLSQALAPTLRELGDASGRERQNLEASSIARGAFGGSRQILADQEAQKNYLQTVGDVTGQHYARGFDTALQAFNTDRAALNQAALTEAQLGGVSSGLENESIDRLLATGALSRGVDIENLQAGQRNFLEERDWDERQLDTLIRAISGTPYDRETTSQQVMQNPNTGVQIAGLGIAGAGLLASLFGGS